MSCLRLGLDRQLAFAIGLKCPITDGKLERLTAVTRVKINEISPPYLAPFEPGRDDLRSDRRARLLRFNPAMTARDPRLDPHQARRDLAQIEARQRPDLDGLDLRDRERHPLAPAALGS